MTNQMITEPDWDNAPEGATHYSREDDDNHESWWKIDRDASYIICDKGGIYTWEKEAITPSLELIPRPEAIASSKDTGLSRPDAIQWCVNNLKEFTPLGFMVRRCPEGWTLTSNGGEIILCHTFHDPIKKVDFDMAKPEEAWVPEVGGRCLILNNKEYGVEYGLDVIGKEVKLISVNKNSLGVDVATVEYEHGFYCFKLDMLHPPKTQEEIEREEGIKALAELIYKCLSKVVSTEDCGTAIWDAGYRLTEK